MHFFAPLLPNAKHLFFEVFPYFPVDGPYPSRGDLFDTWNDLKVSENGMIR